jgi:hypothetical protein
MTPQRVMKRSAVRGGQGSATGSASQPVTSPSVECNMPPLNVRTADSRRRSEATRLTLNLDSKEILCSSQMGVNSMGSKFGSGA